MEVQSQSTSLTRSLRVLSATTLSATSSKTNREIFGLSLTRALTGTIEPATLLVSTWTVLQIYRSRNIISGQVWVRILRFGLACSERVSADIQTRTTPSYL